MDLAGLKEKLRSLSPLELLEKLKEVLLAVWDKAFSLVMGFFGHSGGTQEDGSSQLARKKRLILFGLAGAAVLLFGLLITFIVVHAGRSEGTVISNIASGFAIPSEELFYPSEPDFLPGFLPEREPKRFWTLDDIRPYWKAPGNSLWWMEEIVSTVDSLMEGVP